MHKSLSARDGSTNWLVTSPSNAGEVPSVRETSSALEGSITWLVTSPSSE